MTLNNCDVHALIWRVKQPLRIDHWPERADIAVDDSSEAMDAADTRPQPPHANVGHLRADLLALGPAPSSDMLVGFFEKGKPVGRDAGGGNAAASGTGASTHVAIPVQRAPEPARAARDNGKTRKRKAPSLAECKQRALAAAVQKRQAKRQRNRG
jgi:hypothetical protein